MANSGQKWTKIVKDFWAKSWPKNKKVVKEKQKQRKVGKGGQSRKSPVPGRGSGRLLVASKRSSSAGGPQPPSPTRRSIKRNAAVLSINVLGFMDVLLAASDGLSVQTPSRSHQGRGIQGASFENILHLSHISLFWLKIHAGFEYTRLFLVHSFCVFGTCFPACFGFWGLGMSPPPCVAMGNRSDLKIGGGAALHCCQKTISGTTTETSPIFLIARSVGMGQSQGKVWSCCLGCVCCQGHFQRLRQPCA